MAPDDGPPCHLLRMPYEITKRILAELSQHDQISVAKTRVSLWQIAYPMAYNTIVVNIGPNREDSEWSNLASGVGLRYVRHLEIRSSFVNDDKPKRAEDLVAGTLIAAARRNTLHTFKITSSVRANRSISAKTIVILLETQHALKSLVLPGIENNRGINVRSYIEHEVAFFSFRDITITASSTITSDQPLHDIVYSSPSLDDIHLRLSSHDSPSIYRGYDFQLQS